MTGCISSLLAGRSLSGSAFRRGLRVLGVGLLLSLLASPAFAAKLTYQVKGLKGENKDNVEAYLNALPVYQERQYRPARAKLPRACKRRCRYMATTSRKSP